MSVLMLCATEYVTKDFSVFARTKSSEADLSFLVVTADSFSTKALVKESEKPQLLYCCHPAFHHPPGCPENFKSKSGRIFTPFLLHYPLLGYFHLQYNTSEQIFPWKLFITYETGGGES